MHYPLRKGLGLRARMAISYVWVTIVSVLLLEAIGFSLAAVVASTYYENKQIPYMELTAQQYATTIATQSRGDVLNPSATYALGTPNVKPPAGVIDPNKGMIIPYINGSLSNNEAVAFALLVIPNGQVIASSYPQRYRRGMFISQLLPDNAQFIRDALAGKSGSKIDAGVLEQTARITETVWGKNHRPIGAIYIQAPIPSLYTQLIQSFALLFLMSGLILLVVTAPIGGIFGIITTRGLVRSLSNLVIATTKFANGDYSQRVRVKRTDEVGQLEQQFNRMAEQLVESITKQQELAEQNARLAERSRISRELHDAISQELFSLSMLAGGIQAALPEESSLQPQVAMLEETTTNVIREMRALLLELRPTRLEEIGLAESLEEIATAYSTRLGITITTKIASVSLNAKAEHALLRITQEAVTNAVRHANANMIEISLMAHNQTIELSIKDGGKGFEPDDRASQHGMGLRLMQERVQELNGTFLLQTSVSNGTHIQVCLPREQASI